MQELEDKKIIRSIDFRQHSSPCSWFSRSLEGHYSIHSRTDITELIKIL